LLAAPGRPEDPPPPFLGLERIIVVATGEAQMASKHLAVVGTAQTLFLCGDFFESNPGVVLDSASRREAKRGQSTNQKGEMVESF